MTVKKKEIIGPKSVKQEMFISSDADITIFGGAMGAGKTFLGIMKYLQYIHLPTFRGVITRRTTPQLTGVGGVLDTAMDLFRKVDPKVRYNSQTKQFKFSSGALIALQHFEYEKDKDNFQGLQANLILVDEAQQYTETQVTYLRGRNRNPKCPEVRPRMMLTCNPEKKSFLRKWIDWWLDSDGFPRKDRDGVKRYYLPLGGKMYWADTAEELIAEHSKSYPNPDECIPTSVVFISANIYDNPPLMEAQPEYIGNLLAMGKIEQAKYLHGCWDAELEGSGYWKKEWCEIVPMPPLNVVKKVRAWDISGSLPSDLMPDPDWTVGTLMSKDKYGMYYVEDVVRFRARHGEVFQKMLETARSDGEDVMIVVPQDPGSAGKQYASVLVRDLAEHGFYSKSKHTSKSKVQRFAPFCASCESGSVKVVVGEWNDEFIQELEAFDGSRRVKDDIVDTCGDAHSMLASGITIPTFTLPESTSTSRFGFA